MEEENIGKYIHILSRQIKRKMDSLLCKYNITGVQSAVLGYIYRESKKGLVYSRDIEKEFDMRRATSAGILSLLEKRGMIVRKSENKDARLKSITLTEKALVFQKEIVEENRKNEKEQRKGLSKKEIEDFLRIISHMSKNIK